MPSISPSSCLRIACALLWLLAANAWSQASADPYRAAVPVGDQGAAELRRAAGAGLAEVLGRVSGRADAAQQTALREPLANADRYIDQYRYEHAEDGSLQLQLQFSPATVSALLRGAGLLAAPTARQGLQLRVDGIEKFSDYTALLAYLNGLGTVKAMPQSIDGNSVTLSLQVSGDTAQMVQQFATDQRLLPEAGVAGAELHYRWQRQGG